MADVPTLMEVDRIVAMPNPVLRNVHITQCYSELSAAMHTRLGGHANWCTFATWASKQAGQTIRKEDLRRAIEHALTTSRATTREMRRVVAAAHPRRNARSIELTQRGLLDALNPFAAIERVSVAVAAGNVKVFAEIGRAFARFIATCLSDTTLIPTNIENFGTALRDGDPPDGQRYLRQAFARYYGAMFENDAKTRTELMLLANLEIGFHEQTRLQPEIQAAMEATSLEPQALAQRALVALYPTRSKSIFLEMQSRRALKQPSEFDQALRRLIALVRKQVRLLLTDCLMTLWVPENTVLRLGDDLPARFPKSLRRIASPVLRALLNHIDPTPNSRRDSGADDWAVLPDRLHFIADMFRCYHHASELFAPPFTAEQLRALHAGHLPEGRL
jgi:hypothetical protein